MIMKETSSWVTAVRWQDRWEILETLPGGGQGEAFRARHISSGQVGFLKTIKSPKDAERRARFFREASAYDTFGVDGVPRLLESNAHRHEDMSVRPYIVTQFIEGPTLRKWRESQTSVSLETAVTVAQRLFDIIDACHCEGCVHRDIKPDNIILEQGALESVWLLDFGLNYHDLPEIDFQTEDWQEVGNRFLRLPELSGGSRLKQDPRSDISFVTGILFYMLTGEHPDVLQDADGRLPHQRPQPLAKLQAVAGTRYPRLTALFDNSFAPLIANRYSNARATRDGMIRMMAEPHLGKSADDDLASILEVLDTSAERRRVQSVMQLSDAVQRVYEVFSQVQASLGGALTLSQTAFTVDEQSGRNTLFWRRAGSGDTLLSTSYEIVTTGDEFVVRMSGETVFRTSQSAPNYGDAFHEAVRAWVLARIRLVVSDPNVLPPEADLFVEVRPCATFEDAAAEAQKTDRHILAFVYDPAQAARGRLRYGLMYFLQSRRTRDTMNGAFVTALVPLSQMVAISDMLNDVSMEQSRWVVLDSALQPVEQAVIYANAQEGERIVADLARRYRQT